ncbi:amphiphysin isoform X2 [Malaya genurostris]|uniref:amphiphysin isoform X2 n=1 Tax=Malaya genurostris TaxID=325434 RepID=UPI0026F3D5E5|nr:amphiphysin isoform X2 [Malaya genurostris]
MAENKGMLLAKSVQKHAGRAKEKLLQNLGKVDRTADEIFDEHLTNFTRQQNSATRLQKEFNNYIRCVRAVQSASKSLMDAINEVYESQWTGSEALYAQTNTVEVLFQDFSHKLGDQVLIPLNTYTSQFPEMRKKVDKRGRKLVDYDSQRHSFQGLQANAAKRKDDIKITKGREQLEEAKRTYEVLNTELHDELPALHDSRILFLVTNLQTLFASEQQFHSETAKIYSELEAIVDKLATESQRGSYTLKKITANSTPSSQPQSPVKANLSIVNNITNGSANANGPASPSPSISPSSDQHLDDSEPSYQNTEVVKSASAALRSSPTNTTSATTTTNNNNIDDPPQPSVAPPKTPVSPPTSEKVTTNGTDLDHDTSSQTQNNTPATIAAVSTASQPPTTAATAPVTPAAGVELQTTSTRSPSPTTPTTAGAAVSQSSATTTDLPPGVLYRVKSTYKYVREDVDELSFEVGDTINVIEYEDPEDQEEGWLMGIKEGTNEKGMFPANFTRPL